MKSHDLKFDMIIRGIVMTRGEAGATIEEMRSDYFYMFGKHWPLKRNETEQIVQYLTEIDGLMLEKMDTGLCIWYIDDLGSRLTDSNNNINMGGQSDSSGEMQNDSNGSIAPHVRRRMLISAFVSGSIVPSLLSASTTTTTTSASSAGITASSATTEPYIAQNEREADKLKRKLSNDSYQHGGKRTKSTEADRLPLIEKNLHMHNWNSATNGTVKQLTTSTEKENSISVPNAIECIEEIEVVSVSEYQAPIKDTEMKKLQKAFPARCQIDEKSNFVQTDSATSTDSIDGELIPPGYAIVGDDFMRSFISFELFGGDFTEKNDKSFSYCFSGQTIRQAYHKVLDKQNDFVVNYPNIIVNVGAIDILLERNLIDIQTEYARLVKAIGTIQCKPILTTIPDILVSPNNPNKKIIRQMVLLFNRFVGDLHDDGYPLIDLYSLLDNTDYHQQPKIIKTRTEGEQKLELRMWSATGRQKIIDVLTQIF